MAGTVVDLLAEVADGAAALVDAVRADQWANPTPCTDWDVRALVTHLVAGNLAFAAAATADSQRAQQPAGSVAEADLAAAFRASAAGLLEAFRQPGALERLMDVPAGRVPGAVAVNLRIVECLVHGWDVAQATGQTTTFSDDVVAEQIGFTRRALGLVPADRHPFAPEQPAPESARPIERLVALLGRPVT